MLIDWRSDRYKELFGHLDEQWQSEQPPRQAYVDGLVDPSLWPAGIGSKNFLHSAGIRDIHRGTQHMLRTLVTAAEHVAKGSASTGMLRSLSQALTDVTTPQLIGLEIAADMVRPLLTDTKHDGRKIASALFATGMSALSATGPVGMAASAIVGLAWAVFSAFNASKEWKEKEKKERMRRAYEMMPPLQQAGSDSDDWYIRTKIYPALQTGNWTRLFAPRFNGKKEWVGAPRNGGYGFAPGDQEDTKDEFGIDTANFDPNDNVGFVPGLNRITSVCQVSLDPMGDDVQYWFENGGPWPIKKMHVTDVGDFYVNSTRYCAIIWAWATKQNASPHLYKLHVGTPDVDDDNCLHTQWRRYYAGAFDFLKRNADEWHKWPEWDLPTGGRVKNAGKPQYLFGSAIGCVATSWACYLHSSSTNLHPRFMKYHPVLPESIKAHHGLPGCVISPAGFYARARFDVHGDLVDDQPRCVRSLYESHVKQTLIKVRRRQEHYLKNSLVCAYVRSGWDAFKDDRLATELDRLREIMLTHPARKKIDLADVPKDEKHRGKNWKGLLIKSGVTKFSPLLGGHALKGAPSAGAVEPNDEPEPNVPNWGSMPFAAPPRPAVPPWYRRGEIIVPATVLTVAGLAGLARWRWRQAR